MADGCGKCDGSGFLVVFRGNTLDVIDCPECLAKGRIVKQPPPLYAKSHVRCKARSDKPCR